MRTIRALAFVALATTGVLLIFGVPAQATTVSFSVFADPHTNPGVVGGTIGFTFAGDMFVGSVQRDGQNVLYATDLNGGNPRLFAPLVSISANPASEHFVASSLGLGGFPLRDIYVASANDIVHISHDGTSANTFVTGLGGAVRGILFDAVGTFNHDMLVTTNTGNVYRVNSAGTPTLLATIGFDTEGLDVAPLGVNFGSFDGRLIVATEGDGRLRAISTTGVVNVLNLTSNPSLGIFNNVIPAGPEELTFVPLNLCQGDATLEGFYGANFPNNVIKASCDQFTSLLGDVVVTQEFSGGVVDVHFNSATNSFDVSSIGRFPSQPEDGIFVTATIITPQPVPEPGSLLLLGTALACLAGRARILRLA